MGFLLANKQKCNGVWLERKTHRLLVNNDALLPVNGEGNASSTTFFSRDKKRAEKQPITEIPW
jgi:hypothetical protein